MYFASIKKIIKFILITLSKFSKVLILVFSELWMQIKIISVIILTIYHFTLAKYLNDFKIDNNHKSTKFFRIYNEIPTIILIVVIFVVIFKPL